MTNHPNRAKKIAIYTRAADGTLSRATSNLTETQFVSDVNAEGRHVMGDDAHQWSSDDRRSGELMGWPERYVYWYGDKFAIALIRNQPK